MSLDLSVIYEIAEVNSGMTDIERLTNLYAFASSVLDLQVEGALVEVGCNKGYTSAFLQMINVTHSIGRPRELHVYDSFAGLPEGGEMDRYLSDTDLSVSVEDLHAVFRRWDLSIPTVHAGWFAETLPSELPDAIAFCYLDGDYYESIACGLDEVVPRLSPGAVLIIDDYCDLDRAPRAWNGLPGVKAACDDYFGPRGETIQTLIGQGDLSFGLYRAPRRAI